MASLPPDSSNLAPTEDNVLDWHNDAIIALDELYEPALSGSDAAREKLRSLADNLVQAAGLYGTEVKARFRP
ncbi:MAG: hypothetical protein ABSA70_09270 [Terriglobia bacterium]